MRSPNNNHKNDKSDDKSVKSTAVTSKRNPKTHETTLAYWTPERMRSATPMPIVLERSSPHKEE